MSTPINNSDSKQFKLYQFLKKKKVDRLSEQEKVMLPVLESMFGGKEVKTELEVKVLAPKGGAKKDKKEEAKKGVSPAPASVPAVTAAPVIKVARPKDESSSSKTKVSVTKKEEVPEKSAFDFLNEEIEQKQKEKEEKRKKRFQMLKSEVQEAAAKNQEAIKKFKEQVDAQVLADLNFKLNSEMTSPKVEVKVLETDKPKTPKVSRYLTSYLEEKGIPLEVYMSKGENQPISQVLEIARAKLVEYENRDSPVVTKEVISDLNLRPEPIVQTADTTPKKFAEELVKLRKGGRPVVRPLNSMINPFDLKVFSWSQPTNQYPVRTEIYKELITAGITEAKDTYNYVNCNGCVEGLMNRMMKSLTSDVQRPAIIKYVNDPTLKCRMLPMDLSGYIFSNRINMDHPALKFINSKSDAGFPFLFDYKTFNKVPKVSDLTLLELEYRNGKLPVPLGKPRPIIEHAMYWAQKVFKECVSGKDNTTVMFERLQTLYDTYPELDTVVLKRKEERMLRSDYKLKVRPYGVYPLYKRLLFKIALHPFEQGLVPFWDRAKAPDSICAYGFSTFYGGGKRILEWINYSRLDSLAIMGDPKDPLKNMHFKGVAYGDDQIWVFVDASGKMFIFVPDVRAMDMSTKKVNAVRTMKHCGQFGPVPYEHQKLLAFALMNAYNTGMLVGGPYRLQKSNSVLSGVNGTTFHNMNSSADIQCIVNTYFSSHDIYFERDDADKNDGICFVDALKEIFEIVDHELGFQFKDVKFPASFVDFVSENHEIAQFLDKGDDIFNVGLKVPFLKQIVVADVEGPYCRPKDLDALLGALVVPGCRGNNYTETLKSRILGLYLTGLWCSERYSKYCVAKYNSLCTAEVNVRVGVMEEDEYDAEFKQTNSFVAELAERLKWNTSDGLPSFWCVRDMYVLSKEEFRSKYVHKVQLFREESTNAPYSPDESLLESTYEPDLPDDLTFDDLLTGSTASLSMGETYSKGVLGQTIGLSEEEKSRRYARRMARYEANIALRNRESNTQHHRVSDNEEQELEEPEYEEFQEEEPEDRPDDERELTEAEQDELEERNHLRQMGWDEAKIDEYFENREVDASDETFYGGEDEDTHDMGKYNDFVYGQTSVDG